ncbi:hypothetical protein MKW98_013851 [Papaver atlanticum]|uniref:SHSP domain-containing protein n=1 Tax=Papaver atlanticum TaxID=357466 RepID=A0AAD4TAN3_9MAGN|nr:hypothetical protein MKW98_013851 [Papaver atlanticum]
MSIIPSFFGNQRTNVFDPFSLDIWDPFQGFPFSTGALTGQQGGSGTARETSQLANTRIDWKETPEAHVFRADLPGRILQLSGERSRESEEKNDKWHRVERSSDKFLRRFRLPENTKMDQVKATMENGVLTVCIPKVEQKKPEIKSIEISGSSESSQVPQGQIGAA